MKMSDVDDSLVSHAMAEMANANAVVAVVVGAAANYDDVCCLESVAEAMPRLMMKRAMKQRDKNQS
jgi:hypothetical protein